MENVIASSASESIPYDLNFIAIDLHEADSEFIFLFGSVWLVDYDVFFDD